MWKYQVRSTRWAGRSPVLWHLGDLTCSGLLICRLTSVLLKALFFSCWSAGCILTATSVLVISSTPALDAICPLLCALSSMFFVVLPGAACVTSSPDHRRPAKIWWRPLSSLAPAVTPDRDSRFWQHCYASSRLRSCLWEKTAAMSWGCSSSNLERFMWSRQKGTEGLCQQTCAWAILEADLPVPVKLSKTAVLANILAINSWETLNQNHPHQLSQNQIHNP